MKNEKEDNSSTYRTNVNCSTQCMWKNEETAVDTNRVTTEGAVSEESNDTAVEVKEEASASDFKFEEKNGNLTLAEYNGTDKIVSIPDEVNEKYVVAIGNQAFLGNEEITEVILPDTVLTIEEKKGHLKCVQT